MASIIPVPAFGDNYIWIVRRGAAAVVVDPGDAEPVLAFLAKNRLQPVAILATHHHADHVGGIAALRARFAVPVYGPEREAIPERTHSVRQGDGVALPEIGATLAVLDVPGHTAGHVAYAGEIAGEPVVFCGDTLFAGGCGRLFEGTAAQMWASLSKLAALPPATRVYCAHEYTVSNLRFAAAVEPGNADLARRREDADARRARGEPTVPSTIADELATNPFLRVEVPAVSASAQAKAGRALPSAADRFAVLRAWKNAF